MLLVSLKAKKLRRVLVDAKRISGVASDCVVAYQARAESRLPKDFVVLHQIYDVE